MLSVVCNVENLLDGDDDERLERYQRHTCQEAAQPRRTVLKSRPCFTRRVNAEVEAFFAHENRKCGLTKRPCPTMTLPEMCSSHHTTFAPILQGQTTETPVRKNCRMIELRWCGKSVLRKTLDNALLLALVLGLTVLCGSRLVRSCADTDVGGNPLSA